MVGAEGFSLSPAAPIADGQATAVGERGGRLDLPLAVESQNQERGGYSPGAGLLVGGLSWESHHTTHDAYSNTLSDVRADTLSQVPVLSRHPAARTARRERVAEALLEATRRLLDRGASFVDLRIEEIAREAGISRSAFYNYFDDKRDLLVRLIERTTEPLVAQVDELMGGRPSGPEGVRESLERAFELAREHERIVLAAAQAATVDEAIAELWRELLARFVGAVAARIERQQQVGMVLPGPARAQAVVLVAMVSEAFVRQLQGFTGLSDGELLEACQVTWVRATYGPEASGDERRS